MLTIVLAAGAGTRMRPLTDARPKPTLPVADRPLIAHVLDAAARAGATRFVVVVSDDDAVPEAIGTEYAGVPVAYARQPTPRGTADAVACAREHIRDDPFVVLNGDVFYDDASLARLYGPDPAVGAYRAADPSEYGVLLTDETATADGEGAVEANDGETGTATGTTDADDALSVHGVIEKPANPPSNLVNAGAYVFPAVAREWLETPESERGERELTDVLARVCAEFDVRAVPVDRWLDVGRPWELLAANEWKLGELERRIDGDVSEAAHVEPGPVVVEAGATVRAGATIESPALIRAGASVGPNAYLRGATLVGEGARVGHAVEVKNSVLMAGAHVSHLSYVGDSVLGRDVNFGAGTTVANLRHDDADVRVTVKGDRLSTGRRKFGVVVGHGAKTGLNTSLNAGVTLEPGATTMPGESVLRDR